MLIKRLMEPMVLGEAEGVAPWVGVDEAEEEALVSCVVTLACVRLEGVV